MAKGNRGGKRGSSSGKSDSVFIGTDLLTGKPMYMQTGGSSQDELKSEMKFYYSPDETYSLAKKYSTEKATSDNFFENSIGFWDKESSTPNRPADYISYNKRNGQVSSKYWYTKQGVYRESDHWGNDVASCSWFLKGVDYNYRSGVQVGKPITAFIAWKDLKAKGKVTKVKVGKDYVYGLEGFKFKKK